ncbi:MAG: hypothetical protein PUD66_01455, partial [Oscillospiraceae bacterium]|nr:hypothetical protein [Oscillospiraceae bacterium]
QLLAKLLHNRFFLLLEYFLAGIHQRLESPRRLWLALGAFVCSCIIYSIFSFVKRKITKNYKNYYSSITSSRQSCFLPFPAVTFLPENMEKLVAVSCFSGCFARNSYRIETTVAVSDFIKS